MNINPRNMTNGDIDIDDGITDITDYESQMLSRGQKYTHPWCHSRRVKRGLCILVSVCALIGLSVGITKNNKKSPIFLVLSVAFPTAVHILIYPLLVWILSKLFFYHTFAMGQTLAYECANFFALMVLIYTLPLLLFWFGVIPKRGNNLSITSPKAEFIQTILVSDKDTKRLISTSDILYFSASSPYISIHLNDKKYLHQETLKSIYSRLNPDQFIRIHKSSLVNIAAIVSCKTRFNGDYDIRLVNGAVLRVSRNYAENFKRLFFLHGSP